MAARIRRARHGERKQRHVHGFLESDVLPSVDRVLSGTVRRARKFGDADSRTECNADDGANRRAFGASDRNADADAHADGRTESDADSGVRSAALDAVV